MSSPPSTDIFSSNPYAGHSSITELESEVLWEYAKLAQNVKQLTGRTQQLTESPNRQMVERLRTLENKLGLVLTLFKASVWGVINDQPMEEPSASYDDQTDSTVDATIRH